MQSKQILLGLAVIICLIQVSYSLECFICNSQNIAKCADPFDKGSVQQLECNTMTNRPHYIPASAKNATSCLKNIIEKDGKHIIVRGCYYEYQGDGKPNCNVDPSFGADSYKSCLLCQGNACNGVSSILPISMAVILSTFAIIKYIV